MNCEQLTTIEDIQSFLAGTQAVMFTVVTCKAERYDWIREALGQAALRGSAQGR